MGSIGRYLGQAALYAAFFLPVVYLTHLPEHRHLADGLAVLKVAVRHAGKVIGECTPIEGEAYDKLASNMKRPEICPRERSPLQLVVLVDDVTLYRATVSPSGLHDDGVSSMYRRFNVPAGRHRIELLMNDDVAAEGYTWRLDEEVELRPAQVLVASFKEGFRLQ